MSDQMIDTRLEGLLRQSLKAEAATLPLRVTADQVMDRVTARGPRSGLLGRVQLNRLALQVGAVVVVIVAAFGIGIWVSRPNEIGPQPSPSASPTASPPSADLGIFEPVAGWIVYRNANGFANAAGIWAIDPVTLDPETRVRLITEPGDPIAWSSDGTRLLINRDGQLLVVHSDGTETHLGNTESGGAAFNPDGSQVIFRDGDDLYVVDAKGGTPELLQADAPAGALSPDGTQIAYTAGGGDHSNSVWLANADGSDAHVIVSNESNQWPGHVRGGPVWSPAGDRIALALGGRIYTFAPDGSGFTQIAGLEPSDSGCASPEECSLEHRLYGSAPYWSPDGTQIAYSTGCTDGRVGCGLAIVDADGSDLRNTGLAFSGPWHPSYPSTSPSPLASASPMSPTTRPTGSQEFIHLWPDTTENAPGLYSWRGSGGDSNRIEGFMHNGYGSGDVTILMNLAPEEPRPADTTPVTVGGYEATHRRFDPQVDDWAVDIGWTIDPDDALAEEWIVDIDGTAFVIHLIAREGTSQAELDEADAIIDSIRIEQYPTLGFRVIFRLVTDDWDSG